MQTKLIERTEDKLFPEKYELMKTYGKDKRLIIYTRCPICNNIIAIDSKLHKITIDDNKVTASPSLVCPIKECGWHVFLRDGKYV